MATDTVSKPTRRPRATSSSIERQLLNEVLALKDQVHLLATNIEHQTNAIGQTQMLVQRDVAALGAKVETLMLWKGEMDQEAAEQRGAARMRKTMLAIVASVSGLVGGVISALVGWWIRHGS